MRILKDFILLFLLVLLQVFLFNNFLFFGYMNPYIYVYWILSRGREEQRAYHLLLAFLLGSSIDIFEGSAGVHAFASTLIAYLLPYIWRIFRAPGDENDESTWLAQLSLERKLIFLFVALFVHHLCLFSIENFGFENFGILLQRSLYSSLFSFTFVGIHQFWKSRS